MRSCLLGLLFPVLSLSAAAAAPVVSDDRLTIELVAQQPDIVTPTGIACDEQGRVWIIENNTHQRPPSYKGHPHDRIRIFSDPGPDGKFRKITTFADGFKNAMGISFGEPGRVSDGVLYLATRSEIYRLRDTKGTGEADERKVIVKLETKGDYPHNGLSGFAFHAIGEMYFGLGENLGVDYKLIGSDGVTLTGGGEGGSVYRCKPDGSKLERVATGFWNPFAMTFDAFGRLFAVDNDPDARGPCRLLHVVQGGDYGYRFRNGRKGLHPFTAWNGELPGTLPMVAGTAEAPSGIISYESIGLPTEYRGKLLVTSWGDHVIESFTLKEKGASFSATSTILVKGDENFRPVGIITAPDGSIYISDWVDKSYPVHGKGRIWRICMKNPPKDDGLRPSKVAKMDVDQLAKLLVDARIEIRHAAALALASKSNSGDFHLKLELQKGSDTRSRVQALYALASRDFKAPLDFQAAIRCLEDKSPELSGEAACLVGRQIVPDGRFRLPAESSLLALDTSKPHPFVRMQAIAQLRSKGPVSAVLPLLSNSDPFVLGAVLEILGRSGNTGILAPSLESNDPKFRLGVAMALRRTGDKEALDFLPRFLADRDPAVRRFAIQWIGEDRLKQYRVAIEQAAAKEPVTKELFEALLASQDFLNNTFKPNLEAAGENYVAKIVKDDKQPAVFRTYGLRMVRPDHPLLTPDLLTGLLSNENPKLRQEAARTLALKTDDVSQNFLRTLALDRTVDKQQRALAAMGLAASASNSIETRSTLFALLDDTDTQRDALRSLRDAPLSPGELDKLYAWWDKLPAEKGDPSDARRELAAQLLFVLGPNGDAARKKKLQDLVGLTPATQDEFQKAMIGKGDAAAGERVFLHSKAARCATCHRIDGRGGQIGPELSMIAKSHDRNKLIESILNPSKEIAPMFTSWVITMTNGKTYTGVILGENFDSTITVADAEGKLIKLKRLDIEERKPSTKSLMPDDLHKQMTRREFQDLLEYLGSVHN